MKKNKHYMEIIKQIIEIETNDFEIKTLRTALEIINKTNFFYYQNKISNQEVTKLTKLLNETIQTKLLQLNPNLPKNTLNNICKCYDREYICLPNDVTVIDNNIVFYQENNYGNPYDTRIILLTNNEKTKFTEITKKEISTIKQVEKTNQLINIINKVLSSEIFYEKSFITIKNNKLAYTSYYKIYITPNLNQIIDNINRKNNTTIELIVLGDWNEFYCFKINLTTSKTKSLNWTFEKTVPNIWNLTEEIEKQYQPKTLTKKNKL